MSLSPRLRAVAGLVPQKARSAADVGAGDGQLALALSGRGLHVIATERAAGPFQRLRRLAGGLECRLGEGLDPLREGEVEGVVLAGMGGPTIARVLSRGAVVARRLSWLVLQPQQRAHQLERWLAAHGYEIMRAEWAIQGHRLYRVLLVAPES
jgi:tRNA (adenine22-N1)-methyltransferase